MQKLFLENNRYLALDFGEKQIGLAVSDETNTIALPLKQIPFLGMKELTETLCRIQSDYHIGHFVWGWPLHLNGTTRPLCEKIQKIATEIEESLKIQTHFIDERFSSKVMESQMIMADFSRKKRADLCDKLAACEILKTALEARV